MIPGIFLLLCMLPFFAFLVEWWGLDPVHMGIVAVAILGSMCGMRGPGRCIFALVEWNSLGGVRRVCRLRSLALRNTPPGLYRIASCSMGLHREPAPADLARSGRSRPTIEEASILRREQPASRSLCSRSRRRRFAARSWPRRHASPKAAASARGPAAGCESPAWWPRPALDGNPVLWREWRRTRGALGVQAFWLLYIARCGHRHCHRCAQHTGSPSVCSPFSHGDRRLRAWNRCSGSGNPGQLRLVRREDLRAGKESTCSLRRRCRPPRS